MAVLVLSSCGSLTESEAQIKMDAALAEQTLIACDCIKSGGNEKESMSNFEICRGEAQTALYDIARDNGIKETYPKIVDASVDKLFLSVESCK